MPRRLVIHDFEWLTKFVNAPGQNDAPWVSIERQVGAGFHVIGVHKLTGAENAGNHHVYLAVIGEDGKRVNGAVIEWGWDGMRFDEHASPVHLDKPEGEPWGNIALWQGQVANVRVAGAPSDRVCNLTTAPQLPDEPGATRFHQSYLVVWQHGGVAVPEPPVVPPVEPPPTPPVVPGEPFDVEQVYDLMVEAASAYQQANNILVTAIQRLADLRAAHL